MNKNLAFALGLIGAACLAALAVPEFSSQLPYHLGSALSAAIAAFLYKLNTASEPTPSTEGGAS